MKKEVPYLKLIKNDPDNEEYKKRHKYDKDLEDLHYGHEMTKEDWDKAIDKERRSLDFWS